MLEAGRTDHVMTLMTAAYAKAADDRRVCVGVADIVRAQGVFQKRVPGGLKVF